MIAMKTAKTGVSQVSKEVVDRTIRNHVVGSFGVGLIPMPLVDIVALTGVQLNMIRRMSRLYGIPFSRDRVKHIISALVGSTAPAATWRYLFSVAKSVPVFGQATAVLVMPATGAAATYAVGKVFFQHFATGGTFLDFDPESAKAYYAEMLAEGEEVVSELKARAALGDIEGTAVKPPDAMDVETPAPETTSQETTLQKASPTSETPTPETDKKQSDIEAEEQPENDTDDAAADDKKGGGRRKRKK
jgi:uncharacterized protein (DUF697 family)